MILADWFWRFIVFSFLGWLMESVLFTVRERRWVNRGFLSGPLCPIYGVGGVGLLAALGLFSESWPLVLLIGIVLTTLLEYLTSWLLEWLFHVRWWDYSKQRFNLQGRITLLHSLFWGVLCLALVYGLNPLLAVLLALAAPTVRLAAGGVAAAVLLIDLVTTVLGLIDLNRQLARLQEMTRLIRQKNQELNQNVRERLTFLARSFRELRLQSGRLNGVQRRLLRAFPNLRSLSYPEALRRLKRWARQHAGQVIWPAAELQLLRDRLPPLRKRR